VKEGDEPEVWSFLVTVTQEDIDAWGVQYEPHEGLIGLNELLEQGIYQVERAENDGKGWIGYKDYVDNPEKYPRATASGKIEIYCQVKADLLNQTGLSSDVIKPYPHYIKPVEGYEASFTDWEAKTKGEYDLQAYQPHYLRRAHTTFDNLPWLQEAFENPVFMNADDAKSRGIANGDTVLVSSKWGKVLRHASLLESVMPGTIGVPHGVRVDIDEATGIDKGGNENVLLGPVHSNFLPHLCGYNTNLVKVEKYSEEIPFDYEKQFIVDVD
jgi:anaerobic dimethyl sulfoxide reductase subunit A